MLTKRSYRPRNNSGYILVVTMVFLVVFTGFVAQGLQQSMQNTKATGMKAKKLQASYNAESALNITILDIFNQIKGGTKTTNLPTTFSGEVGGEQYNITREAYNDVTDGFKLVVSAQNKHASSRVEAYYEVITTGELPPTDQAVGTCGDLEIEEGADQIHGEDYIPPTYPCSGVGCDGSLSGNPDIPGVSVDSSGSLTIGGGLPTGNPPVQDPTDLDCSEWVTFTDELVPDQIIDVNDIETTLIDWGTPDNPKIIKIIGEGEAEINTSVFGAGILIIEVTDNTDEDGDGEGEIEIEPEDGAEFIFQGLIIVKSVSEFEIEGKAQIFGSVISLGNSEFELENDDDGDGQGTMKYSSEALESALGATPQGVLTIERRAWRTVQ